MSAKAVAQVRFGLRKRAPALARHTWMHQSLPCLVYLLYAPFIRPCSNIVPLLLAVRTSGNEASLVWQGWTLDLRFVDS